MANNDRNAQFDSIVVPHLEDAYSLARWLTRSRADADDVLQEACIRALGAVGQHKGENPRAWVLAIVRNTAYTWMSSKRATLLVGFDDLAEKERMEVEFGKGRGEGTIDAESELVARADAKQLEEHIAALPIEFREALVLRDLHGLGYREISQVTGAPVGTVMSRLARARSRLIAAIREGNT